MQTNKPSVLLPGILIYSQENGTLLLSTVPYDSLITLPTKKKVEDPELLRDIEKMKLLYHVQ